MSEQARWRVYWWAAWQGTLGAFAVGGALVLFATVLAALNHSSIDPNPWVGAAVLLLAWVNVGLFLMPFTILTALHQEAKARKDFPLFEGIGYAAVGMAFGYFVGFALWMIWPGHFAENAAFLHGNKDTLNGSDVSFISMLILGALIGAAINTGWQFKKSRNPDVSLFRWMMSGLASTPTIIDQTGKALEVARAVVEAMVMLAIGAGLFLGSFWLWSQLANEDLFYKATAAVPLFLGVAAVWSAVKRVREAFRGKARLDGEGAHGQARKATEAEATARARGSGSKPRWASERYND